jgi:hypothetical protein
METLRTNHPRDFGVKFNRGSLDLDDHCHRTTSAQVYQNVTSRAIYTIKVLKYMRGFYSNVPLESSRKCSVMLDSSISAAGRIV